MDEKKVIEAGTFQDGKLYFSFSENKFRIHERRVLELGLCKGIPPVRILETQTEELVYYDCDQLQTLETILKKKALQGMKLMNFLGRMIMILLNGADQLLVPEDFALDVRMVLVDEASCSPKLIYLPSGTYQGSFTEHLNSLLVGIDEIPGDEEWLAYSPELRRNLGERSLSLQSVLRLFQEKERAMYHARWPAVSLERTAALDALVPFCDEEPELKKSNFFRTLWEKIF